MFLQLQGILALMIRLIIHQKRLIIYQKQQREAATRETLKLGFRVFSY